MNYCTRDSECSGTSHCIKIGKHKGKCVKPFRSWGSRAFRPSLCTDCPSSRPLSGATVTIPGTTLPNYGTGCITPFDVATDVSVGEPEKIGDYNYAANMKDYAYADQVMEDEEQDEDFNYPYYYGIRPRRYYRYSPYYYNSRYYW